MELKLDDAGHAVLQDGKPVYVYPDGKEVAFDAPGTVATITRLNGEAKGHREARERAEAAIKAFDGLDAEAARKALATVANLDGKKLIDAGEAERVKAEVAKVYTEKLTAAEKRAAEIEASWHKSEIDRAFASSKFIAEKSAIPADFVRAAFADRVKVEDGKVAVYDATGSRIFSRSNPGNAADFDEALSILVDSHPQRDSILKGNTNGGGGTRQTQTGGARSVTRAQFDAMSPADQMKAVNVDKMQITD